MPNPPVLNAPPSPGKGRARTITQCQADPTCTRKIKSRSMCDYHYQTWYKSGGQEMADSYSKNRDPLAKLWENTTIDPLTACWEYKRGLVTGYGKVWHDGKWYVAHRLGYSLLIGEIPSGLVLDHMCQNQTDGCWNPWHTEPVTQRINLMRGRGSLCAGFLAKSHPNCVCRDRSAAVCPDHGQLHWRPDWAQCLAAIQMMSAQSTSITQDSDA